MANEVFINDVHQQARPNINDTHISTTNNLNNYTYKEKTYKELEESTVLPYFTSYARPSTAAAVASLPPPTMTTIPTPNFKITTTSVPGQSEQNNTTPTEYNPSYIGSLKTPHIRHLIAT
jgi:hypothetical protein